MSRLTTWSSVRLLLLPLDCWPITICKEGNINRCRWTLPGNSSDISSQHATKYAFVRHYRSTQMHACFAVMYYSFPIYNGHRVCIIPGLIGISNISVHHTIRCKLLNVHSLPVLLICPLTLNNLWLHHGHSCSIRVTNTFAGTVLRENKTSLHKMGTFLALALNTILNVQTMWPFARAVIGLYFEILFKFVYFLYSTFHRATYELQVKIQNWSQRLSTLLNVLFQVL